MHKNAALHRPIIFGEVLFDQFEDGTQVLGGAPFNVAFHLNAFGLKPIFVSRIGKDNLGAKVLATMQEWQMDCAGLQVDSNHSTGTVKVSLLNGQPVYTILPNQAYDFIDASEVYRALKNVPVSLLYFGTLALRNHVSLAALRDLSAWSQAPAYVDLNLRSPWWDTESLSRTLQTARWAKVNEEELLIMSGRSIMLRAQLEQAAMQVRTQYGLDLLIVTLGEGGSFFVTSSIMNFEPSQVISIVDTVGAGDAFSAVVILGLVKEWPVKIIQLRATQFAASICEIKGAINPSPSLYTAFNKRWAE